MTQKLISFFILFFLTLASVAGAGGSVPATYGTTYGGNTYVPKSSTITWSSYGQPLTDPVLRDIIALATASLDRETQSFRLLHDAHPELSSYHVYFAFIGGEPDSKCLDDIPGGCSLGLFTCMKWATDGHYRVCYEGRIRIYTANIAVKGPVHERLHDIIRHEWTHALGFSDGVGGPTNNGANEFTDCQLAQMISYDYDPEVVGWTVATLPECE